MFDMSKPCPECGADKGDPCARVMERERATVREMDALLARAADKLNNSIDMNHMNLGHEITEFRRAILSRKGTKMAKDSPIEVIKAGHEFRESMVERADYVKDGAPVWHGWVIVEYARTHNEHQYEWSPMVKDHSHKAGNAT